MYFLLKVASKMHLSRGPFKASNGFSLVIEMMCNQELRHRPDVKRLGNYVASCKTPGKFGSGGCVLASDRACFGPGPGVIWFRPGVIWFGF